jgi:iron uptake system component EfeO
MRFRALAPISACWLARLSAVALALVCLTLLGSFGAFGGTSPAINIDVRDNVFSPDTVVAAAGAPVSVTFHNLGGAPHVIQIVGLTDQTVIQPGQSAAFMVTPQAQRYPFVDALYGPDGMVGVLIGSASAQHTLSPTVSRSVAIQGTGAEYKTYLLNQSDQLVASAQTLADAIEAGDLNRSKTLYVSTRQYYERIGPSRAPSAR